MTMVCSRVDCTERAAALLVYDPRGAAAWLRDRDPVGDRGQAIVLCSDHADRASVPVGWTLTDERSPMFTAPPEPVIDLVDTEGTVPSDLGAATWAEPTDVAESVTAVPPPPEPAAPAEPEPSAPAARVDADEEVAEATSSMPETDAEVLTLWADQVAEDPDGPQSPLLARAFRAAHRH